MSIDILGTIQQLYATSGIALFIQNPQALIMVAVACLLLYLAIVKKFEPLLLLPIAWKNSVLFSNSIMYLVLQWSMELSVNCVPMKIVPCVVKCVTIRRKC